MIQSHSLNTQPSFLLDNRDFHMQRLDLIPKKKVALPINFAPHENSVVIAKGRNAKSNPGNQQLRALVESNLEEYSKCTLKRDKTLIVSNILYLVQKKSNFEGAFVKYVEDQWWEVDEKTARENCSIQVKSFDDGSLLHSL